MSALGHERSFPAVCTTCGVIAPIIGPGTMLRAWAAQPALRQTPGCGCYRLKQNDSAMGIDLRVTCGLHDRVTYRLHAIEAANVFSRT
jgi:hypothetical protein